MWFRSKRLGLETVSRRTNVSSRSRLGLGAICLGLCPVSLVSGLGPLRLAMHTVAAVRAMLTSMTFVA